MKKGDRVQWVQSVQTGTMDLVKQTCEGTLVWVDGHLASVMRDYDGNMCVMLRGVLSLIRKGSSEPKPASKRPGKVSAAKAGTGGKRQGKPVLKVRSKPR